MLPETLLKTAQAKYEAKARQDEIDALLHWRVQLEKIVAAKPEGVASLQLQIKKVIDMMSNRVQILKKELQ
jgi:hypothetical protein